MAAVAIATRLMDHPWAATVAGVMAVVGHDWSIYIGFGGGIGLSKLTGALASLSLWHTLGGLALVALVWFGLVKLARVHRARATILAVLTIGPILWLLKMEPQGILLGALSGVAVAIKTLPDWDRTYD
jgi:glycerol-3-phosphate acyltransferase PlsY